ncbi:MAG TPA: PEGA domain-containing protein [Polyangia bacterium]|jgi:hypothetical protein|nr:PEGA domain-containing protein [Polyangia bacterium]
MTWKPSPISDRRWGRRGAPALGGLCLAALVLLSSVAVPRGSEAAPASAAGNAKSTARKKLLEGAGLLKRGEFQAALERFQAAYNLVPNPKIQYNFALAYMGLGRNAEALQALHTFLSDANDASSEAIANARNHKDALIKLICRLTVRSDVAGAAITIDGHPQGVTPRADEIFLDAGLHSLVVDKPGVGKTFTKWFEAAAGNSLTIEADLLPPRPKPARTATGTAPSPVAARAAPAGAGATDPNLAGTVAAPPAAPAPGAGSRWARWTGFTAGGLAVVALGFGTVEWVIKEQKYVKFNDQGCDKRFDDLGGGNCATLLRDGDRAKRLGYLGFAAGGGLAVASTVLLIVNARTHADGRAESALACAPSLAVPGASCSLRF